MVDGAFVHHLVRRLLCFRKRSNDRIQEVYRLVPYHYSSPINGQDWDKEQLHDLALSVCIPFLMLRVSTFLTPFILSVPKAFVARPFLHPFSNPRHPHLPIPHLPRTTLPTVSTRRTAATTLALISRNTRLTLRSRKQLVPSLISHSIHPLLWPPLPRGPLTPTYRKMWTLKPRCLRFHLLLLLPVSGR